MFEASNSRTSNTTTSQAQIKHLNRKRLIVYGILAKEIPALVIALRMRVSGVFPAIHDSA
jgi:hypothetical protein